MFLTPAVRTILIVTVGIYFLQMMLPGSALEMWLGLLPRNAIVMPWTLVTYMLLHSTSSIMHLLGNMLGLFFFGPRVEERIGTRHFWWLYIVSGLTGALLSFFTPNAFIIGASGGVFGVTLAFAYFWPDAPIYIWGVLPVPARLLVIGYGLISIFSIVPRGGSGGGGIAHLAHLGGYLGAFLYLKWMERGRATFKKKVTAPPPAVDRALSRWKAVDRTKVHEVNREELDRILDKISAQGLASLTPQERTFLAHFVPPDDRVPPVQ